SACMAICAGGYFRWIISFFFFQAEDGIRDFHVTGVQTCALPILRGGRDASDEILSVLDVEVAGRIVLSGRDLPAKQPLVESFHRSEERRVGKECRARWWPDQ